MKRKKKDSSKLCHCISAPSTVLDKSDMDHVLQELQKVGEVGVEVARHTMQGTHGKNGSVQAKWSTSEASWRRKGMSCP